MRHKGRTMFTALLAVFALGALAAASASASTLQPEFVPGPGASFPVAIENGMHAGRVSFEWTSTDWGTCSEKRRSGKIISAGPASLTLEWAGCSSKETRWHTEGAPEGHVVITGIGHLNYISSSPAKVGLVLAINETKLIAGSSYIKLRGSLVIPVGPLNTEAVKLGLPTHEHGL